MASYEEILESAKRLSSVERLQLADALLAEELGFGMWRGREDVADAKMSRTRRPMCLICAKKICRRRTDARRLPKSFFATQRLLERDDIERRSRRFARANFTVDAIGG